MSKMLSVFCRNCGNEFLSNGPEYCTALCAKNATGDASQSNVVGKRIIVPGLPGNEYRA